MKRKDFLKGMLTKTYIIEVADNKGRKPKLGVGFMTATRFNRYNPLSYVLIFVMLLIIFFTSGIKGVKKEIKCNPFKWY